jgi:hypothetical protein
MSSTEIGSFAIFGLRLLWNKKDSGIQQGAMIVVARFGRLVRFVEKKSRCFVHANEKRRAGVRATPRLISNQIMRHR